MITLVPSIASPAAGPAAAASASAARPSAAAQSASAADASFSSVLRQLTTEAVDTIKAGESTAIAGVESKASVQQVVDSIMSAERTLQTMIAVRDKAVNAYQEISKMAI